VYYLTKNVADVTVDDVTVETTNAEENITETVFKPAELGGNHERALALAFTKEKEGKEREKKKMADNQQRVKADPILNVFYLKSISIGLVRHDHVQ